MIWKLLRRNISAWQIAGYALATLAGIVIVLAALQFYRDLRGTLGGHDGDGVSLISPRNLVISRHVGLGATLGGQAPAFSHDDIAELQHQPWVDEVEQFRAADFSVWARAAIGGAHLSTALFFESIPDHLLDDDIDGFEFDPDDPFIPIVLARDYLSLYNFGFAAGGRMPVVSEGIISSLPLEITLAGNGRYDSFPARIVGFSSWLNTIAVPEKFMDWAHERYGSGNAEPPTRLIVRVSDPGDPAVSDFMESHGYDVAGPEDSSSRAGHVLGIVSAAVAGVGAIITLLAFFILVLSVFLLVSKNRRTIRGLLLLGYSPSMVTRRYVALVAAVNSLVLLFALVIVVFLARLWQPALTAMQADGASMWLTILAGIGLMAFITALNALIIGRSVRRCF